MTFHTDVADAGPVSVARLGRKSAPHAIHAATHTSRPASCSSVVPNSEETLTSTPSSTSSQAAKANRQVEKGRYSANITAGPLMLPESRRIAALLLTAPNKEAWQHAIRFENLLQKSTPATALRLARLIRDRLDTMPPAAWQIVASGSHEAATQTLLVAALRHSPLLADFFRQVVAAHYRKLDTELTSREWEPFLADCAAREPEVAAWTTTTRAKVFQVIVRILAGARYLESTRTLRLRAVSLHPDVLGLLKTTGDQNLIDILELRA